MTKSEKICNEIGAKFFCKDFVYENLKYYNSNNEKVELCDALFEYADFYVPLQIKERSNSKSGKSENQWLSDVVYGDALEQIKMTIFAIRNNRILVNDLYHQPVEICKTYKIFPVIVFDNPLIKDYQRVVKEGDLEINIFKLEDYEAMMAVIMHPYDIVYYLQERVNLLCTNNLPHMIFGDGINSSIIARIETEKDFSVFFKQYIYDGHENGQYDAMRQLALIGTFRGRQIKKNPNYKLILKILQLVDPKTAKEFMCRFDYAWKCACEDKFDFTKAMQVVVENKRTDIIFFSLGRKELKSHEHYQVFFDAKQLQHKADAILAIVFIGNENNQCRHDWLYFERPYMEDANALKFYETIGMFDGTIDFDTYEELCCKLLNITE